MTSPRRWILRIVGGGLVCLVVGGVALRLALPALVEKVVAGQLVSLGLPESSFVLAEADFSHAVVRDLHYADGERARVKEIRFEYSLDDLWRRRVSLIRVRGFHFELRVRDGEVDWGPGARIQLDGGGGFPFDRVTYDDARIRLRWDDTLLDVPFSGEFVEAASPVWHADMRVQLPGGMATLQADLNVETSASDETLTVDALDFGELFSALPPLAAYVPLRLSGAGRFNAHFRFGEEVTALTLSLKGQSLEAQGDIESTALAAEFSSLLLEVEMGVGAALWDLNRAKATVEGLTVTFGDGDFRVVDVSGTVPVNWGEGEDESAGTETLRVGSIEGGGMAVRDAVFALTPIERGVSFTGTAELLQGVRMDVTGQGAWVDNAPRVQAKLAVPPSTLTDPDALAGFMPQVKGWRVTGGIGMGGDFAWHNGPPALSLTVTADDLSLDNRVWDMSISGLSGTVEVDPLTKRFGNVWQKLNMREIRFGALVLKDGHVRFRAEGDNIRLGEVGCDWADGRIRAEDVLLDMANGRSDMSLLIEGVDLGQALSFVAVGRAEGAGRVSGRWRIRPVWNPEADLEFGSGELESDSASGWFKILSEEDGGQLAQVRVQNAPAIGSQEELMGKIQRALTDFEFTALRIEFRELPQGGISTHVNLQGRGPRGERPLSFGGLTFNVNGLDTLLRTLIVRTREAKAHMQDRLRGAFRALMESRAEPAEPDAQKQAEDKAIEAFF